MTDLSSLKSGTDFRGTAVDGVSGQPLALTDEAVSAVGYAFCAWLSENVRTDEPKYKVAVGHDSRISADRIYKAFSAALTDCGVNIEYMDLASTPAMFMICADGLADAGVSITASHHPFNKNGLKFFTKNGGFESTDIDALIELAENGARPVNDIKGTISQCSYMNTYAEHLRDLICTQVNADDFARPLRGTKIVVDAGNGVGGFYAYKVLQPLGADIDGSCFLEPDGMFPNHIPNPEDPVAMSYISSAVLKAGADLGIIFDTDVDRAGCVLSDGSEINRNSLIALASCIALEGNEGGTIVTDSVTSDGLTDFIENTLHAHHRRFKRGYKNVINEAKRLNFEECVNAPLAIETSGHAAMRDNYFLDDGAYLMTRIIIKAASLAKEGKNLLSLISDLRSPLEAKEIRIPITDTDFRECGKRILTELGKYAASDPHLSIVPDSFEGVRINVPEAHAWFLLRMSVHDPILPLNIESDDQGGVNTVLGIIKPFFESCSGIDLSVFSKGE